MGYPFARAGYRCVWAGKDMAPSDGSRDFELLCQWGDVQTADHVCDFVRESHDKPFLAVANFVNPHNICEWARNMPLWEGDIGRMPDDRDLPLLPANYGIPPHEPQILREIQSLGLQNFIGKSFSPRQWRQYLWAYYRMVELVDQQIGRILTALDESGRAEDTLVIFMSDHGDGCAAHQWNQKMTFYDEVIRVPLILAGPGVRRGHVSDKLVSTGLDLFPTCCEAAGIATPSELQGRSLLALCGDSAPAKWRDSVFVENALNPEILDRKKAQKANMGRCVITERYKYSVWKWGADREQLIDLRDDPGEMVNLAASRRHDDTLVEMRRRLHDLCQATNDAFQVPTYEILSPGAPRQHG
jgi:arylsulfatase A-like enzyme